MQMLYEWWERYRRVLIIAGIFLLVTLSFLLYPGASAEQAPSVPLETPVYASENATKPLNQPAKEEEKGTVKSGAQNSSGDKSHEPPALIYVDVKGSVKKPGLYTFARQQRVADAIDKAGGALPNAELAEINLAQLLTDGSILRIPAKGEMLKAASPCTQGGQPYLAPGNGSSAEKANPSPSSTGTGEGKININTASLQELMNLPGIGETRAKAILAYREKNGQFRSLDQLKKVGGIGERTYEQLKSKISL